MVRLSGGIHSGVVAHPDLRRLGPETAFWEVATKPGHWIARFRGHFAGALLFSAYGWWW
ncbi:hypothetical protein SBA4_1010027 [Candidatus Sulfopaludibacter sp. SbA4]|nr:hypothetical protein SBA4_1010027 [Candidatus Sulfopaludibacter sp. SbA4]